MGDFERQGCVRMKSSAHWASIRSPVLGDDMSQGQVGAETNAYPFLTGGPLKDHTCRQLE